MIELNKVLMGQNIDEWIRFFNIKTEGELDMLRMQTNNARGDTDKVAQLDDPEVLLAMQRKYGMINL